MLSPHKNDPNRKEALAHKADQPGAFGYHGPRGLPAMIPVGQGLPVQAGGLSPKDEKELEKLRRAASKNEELEKQASRLAKINQAIAVILASGEELGPDGKPDVGRIEAIAQIDVTAEERDKAWGPIAMQLKKREPADKGK